MKTLFRLIAFVLVLAASTVVQASQIYNYSYKLDNGVNVVSGSFTGDASGNLITNLSNITANFDGTPFNSIGYLLSAHYVGIGPAGHWDFNNAVASFNGLQNNFIFTTDSSFTQYFYTIPWSNGSGVTDADQYFSVSTSWITLYNGDYKSANWSVTAATVPEPGTMMLLGFGMLGLAVYGKRRMNKEA